MTDSFRIVNKPSLDVVIDGMRRFAWLGAANPEAVAAINQKRLTQRRLGSMTSGAWLGTSDPKHGAMEIRRLVESICAGLQPGDYAGEILACYYWVCQNIRYMRDPHQVELVKEPIVTLRTRAADCDEIATLLAAMLMGCGNECRFVLISFTPDKQPSHVFTTVKIPKGGWLTLDPVANCVTDEMWGRATNIIQIPCTPPG